MEFVDANLSRRGMYHKQRRRYDTQPLEGFSQQPWQDFHQTQRKNDDEYWCKRPQYKIQVREEQQQSVDSATNNQIQRFHAFLEFFPV